MAGNTEFLINGRYPPGYLLLPGIDSINHPNDLWWSSIERGINTSEVVEIDYGRMRHLNYISMDITKKPLDILIQYDATNFSDGSHTWVPITPLDGNRFDDRISYTAGESNPWHHAEFYFTNNLGDIVSTRFLRITFTRRDESWPTSVYPADTYSVDITNFRSARYILDRDDARGILYEVSDINGQQTFDNLIEVRQSFVMPTGYKRGDNGGLVSSRDSTVTPVAPNVIGFGFLTDIAAPGDVGDLTDVIMPEFKWEIYDLSNNLRTFIASGTVFGGAHYGKAWIDVLFTDGFKIPTDDDSKFQIVISPLTPSIANSIYTQSSNPAGSGVDTDAWIRYSSTGNVDTVTRLEDISLTFRIWADIGETGRDILGNAYREAVRADEATHVLDNATQTAWFSAPCPSPYGVEALYFDVRKEGEEGLITSILDAIRVNPATPGAFMHIYYSTEGWAGNAPDTLEEWESLLWTPVPQTYILDRNATLDLPRPVRAAWICLEFSNLRPVPMDLPSYPELPEVNYKEYPQYVFDDFANGFNIGINSSSSISGVETAEVDIFNTFFSYVNTDPGNRINTGDSETSPTTDPILNILSSSTNSQIDPITLARITLNSPQMFSGNIASNVDTIGQSLFDQNSAFFNAQKNSNVPSESIFSRSDIFGDQPVSNINNRDLHSFSHNAINPVFFKNISRHFYSKVKARFNKKAYYVGITDLEFLRKDYTIKRDDPFIHDVLADSELGNSPLVEINTWAAEIPSGISLGQTVYVTYVVNGTTYRSEAISFENEGTQEFDFNAVTLVGGGGRAQSVEVWSNPNQSGTRFIPNYDYDIAYDPNTFTSSIMRNTLHFRLIVSEEVPNIDFSYVTSSSIISSVNLFNRDESATATSINIISSVDVKTP
jgi:hypothetical protein